MAGPDGDSAIISINRARAYVCSYVLFRNETYTQSRNSNNEVQQCTSTDQPTRAYAVLGLEGSPTDSASVATAPVPEGRFENGLPGADQRSSYVAQRAAMRSASFSRASACGVMSTTRFPIHNSTTHVTGNEIFDRLGERSEIRGAGRWRPGALNAPRAAPVVRARLAEPGQVVVVLGAKGLLPLFVE